ncbi:hypothetical protein BGX38DRAFT_720966 [Terfezia claveryi]|nr:hypothetical protein BGX38DRAFT_720966 [Terfezia claveryi]
MLIKQTYEFQEKLNRYYLLSYFNIHIYFTSYNNYKQLENSVQYPHTPCKPQPYKADDISSKFLDLLGR